MVQSAVKLRGNEKIWAFFWYQSNWSNRTGFFETYHQLIAYFCLFLFSPVMWSWTDFVCFCFLQLCGLGLIVTGCLIHFGLANWIPIQEVAAVLQNEFLRSAVYMIIGAGALVFLIAICGCLGAILENRCLLVLVSTPITPCIRRGFTLRSNITRFDHKCTMVTASGGGGGHP